MNWNRAVQSQSTSHYFSDFRFYDPKVGKFTQADSVVPVPGSLGLNRYAYAYNNPIKYSDPDGHVPRVTQGSDDENVFEKIFFDLVDMVADTADYVIQSNPLAEASQARQTLNDPNASDFDKFKAVAMPALGALAPGGRRVPNKKVPNRVRKHGPWPNSQNLPPNSFRQRALAYGASRLAAARGIDDFVSSGVIPVDSRIRVKTLPAAPETIMQPVFRNPRAGDYTVVGEVAVSVPAMRSPYVAFVRNKGEEGTMTILFDASHRPTEIFFGNRPAPNSPWLAAHDYELEVVMGTDSFGPGTPFKTIEEGLEIMLRAREMEGVPTLRHVKPPGMRDLGLESDGGGRGLGVSGLGNKHDRLTPGENADLGDYLGKSNKD